MFHVRYRLCNTVRRHPWMAGWRDSIGRFRYNTKRKKSRKKMDGIPNPSVLSHNVSYGFWFRGFIKSYSLWVERFLIPDTLSHCLGLHNRFVRNWSTFRSLRPHFSLQAPSTVNVICDMRPEPNLPAYYALQLPGPRGRGRHEYKPVGFCGIRNLQT